MDTTTAWTYELPPEGGGSAGLEGYGVEDSSGVRVGTVYVVLQRDADRIVAVKRGLLSRRGVRLVRWSDVALVDHETETVRLAVSAAELEGLPVLARAQGTDADDADAKRVTEYLSVEGARPYLGAARVDLRMFLMFGLLAVAVLTALAGAIFASGHHSPAREYFVLSLLGLLSLGSLAAAVSSISHARRRPVGRSADGGDGPAAKRA